MLEELKKVIAGIDPKSNNKMTSHNVISFLYNSKQGRNEADDRYYERFTSSTVTAELTDGMGLFASLAIAKCITGEEPDPLPSKADLKTAEDRTKVGLLLKNANSKRYAGIRDETRQTMISI